MLAKIETNRNSFGFVSKLCRVVLIGVCFGGITCGRLGIGVLEPII